VMPKCFQKSKLKQVKGDFLCHLFRGTEIRAYGLAAIGFETSSVVAITDRARRVSVCGVLNEAILSAREWRPGERGGNYISDTIRYSPE
jgi:hypothetical protein